MAAPEHHDDDMIGFSSPQSLAGSARIASPQAGPAASFAREPAPRPSHNQAVVRGLYTRYLLILCAVPTFGVSVLVGLLAVLGRDGRPDDKMAHSHFVYQKRTLIIAAIGAVIGVIGVAVPVVPIGVFILFGLALWIVARGANGLLKLLDDKPIAAPRGWWI